MRVSRAPSQSTIVNGSIDLTVLQIFNQYFICLQKIASCAIQREKNVKRLWKWHLSKSSHFYGTSAEHGTYS